MPGTIRNSTVPRLGPVDLCKRDVLGGSRQYATGSPFDEIGNLTLVSYFCPDLILRQ